MKFKYKNFFSHLVKSVFATHCFVLSALAATNSNSKTPPPSYALDLPTASLAAYSGLGAAAPGDYSSADVNPAIMSAFKKQYVLFGDTSWQHYDNLVGGGIFDNTTTSIATLLHVRESVPNDIDSRDRRFTLGLSYQIPKTNLSLGLTANYEQLVLTNLTSSSSSYNYFAGTGFLYEYIMKSGRPIFIGVGVNKIFDTDSSIEYDTGISTAFFDGFYSLSLDGLSSNISGLEKVVGSLQIVANQYLDLKGSYGYLTKDQKNAWGAGIFFHAPVIQLFYTFASSDIGDTNSVRQTAGCALNFIFDSK
ncbi:MAG: hypothetical protein V4591_11255 [Bdellovibrionota bacterium]